MNDTNEHDDSRPAPSDTRSALLSAGRALFSQRGYDGTSIRALTRQANANLGAVTYHFGSKEALYGAVLEQVLGPLASVVCEVAASPGPTLERVDRTVRAYVRFLATNPDVPRLLLQEVAAGKVPPRPVMDVLSRVAGALSAMLREGQERGEIREGDPLFLTLSMVAQPVYFALVRRIVAQMRGVDPMSGDHLPALEDHIAGVAVAALAAPMSDSDRPGPEG
jgi:TetR/AcrR family transcriptional regulator